MEQSQDGRRCAHRTTAPSVKPGTEDSGAVNATKSECSALPQNGTENDEPECHKNR